MFKSINSKGKAETYNLSGDPMDSLCLLSTKLGLGYP